MSLPSRKTRAWIELAMERIRVGDPSAARKAIDQAKQIAGVLPAKRILKDSWVDIGKAQAVLGDMTDAKQSFEKAREAAQGLEEVGSRPYYFVAIASAQAETGQFDDAWKTTRLIGNETDVFGTLSKDKAIRAIVQALGRAGKSREAEAALAEISGASEKAFALAHLAEIEIQRQARRRAFETAPAAGQDMTKSEDCRQPW